MLKDVAIIVHYGPIEPTTRLANDITQFASQVVVVSNDGNGRPHGLSPYVRWVVAPRNIGYGEAVMLAASTVRASVYVALNTDVHIAKETYAHCLSVLE